MNLFFLFFVFGLLFSMRVLAWQQLDDGLYYKKTEIASAENPVVIHALKVNLKNFKIRTVYQKDGLFAKVHAEQQKALAVINANFFDPQGHVLGLVEQDGVVLNPKKDVLWWSVFCVTDSGAQIMHQSKYHDLLCKEAVEAGPRLVVNGILPALKEEISYKTAVGINKEGHVILVVTANPIPIKELAQLFALPESENGFDCLNAMNLDGGSSTQMYVKINSWELIVPSLIKFPAGLGVFRK